MPDRALLRLINRYLKAGVRVGEHTEATTRGVPQGGPLSPVLANVVLDELDWELNRRGHRFARYADDCNIVVRSERAGLRVMESVARFVRESLRLTVNARKSAVDRPWNRKFLGFTVGRSQAKLKVADKSIDKLKAQVRELTRRTRGHRLSDIVAELRETLLGWKAYFGIAEVLSPGACASKRAQYDRCIRDGWNVECHALGEFRLSTQGGKAIETDSLAQNATTGASADKGGSIWRAVQWNAPN